MLKVFLIIFKEVYRKLCIVHFQKLSLIERIFNPEVRHYLFYFYFYFYFYFCFWFYFYFYFYTKIVVFNKPIHRREFFENYAKVNAFNPLVPDNWYSIPRYKITAVKVNNNNTNIWVVNLIVTFQGARTVLAYHNNSLAQALQNLFPEIEIDKLKFWTQRNYLCLPLPFNSLNF